MCGTVLNTLTNCFGWRGKYLPMLRPGGNYQLDFGQFPLLLSIRPWALFSTVVCSRPLLIPFYNSRQFRRRSIGKRRPCFAASAELAHVRNLIPIRRLDSVLCESPINTGNMNPGVTLFAFHHWPAVINILPVNPTRTIKSPALLSTIIWAVAGFRLRLVLLFFCQPTRFHFSSQQILFMLQFFPFTDPLFALFKPLFPFLFGSFLLLLSVVKKTCACVEYSWKYLL